MSVLTAGEARAAGRQVFRLPQNQDYRREYGYIQS